MRNGMFIVDAVGHGIDFSQSNRVTEVPADAVVDFEHYAHRTFQRHLESKQPGFRLGEKQFVEPWTAEELAYAFFVESDVDFVCCHSVLIPPLFKHGCFRWDTHLELAEIAPNRVMLYAGIDTFGDRKQAFAQMEARVREGAQGFKFYPSNGLFDKTKNDFVTLWYNDSEQAYPYFDKCLELGIKTIAIHKSQPMGTLPMDRVGVGDVSVAAARYPELKFELVHTGWAFLEEATIQLAAFPNVYANLENCFAWAVAEPMRFAHMLGKLLIGAPVEKIIFASGCALNHPEPQLEAFINFKMPKELQEQYGYPEVTDEMKRKILGENFAALHGLNLQTLQRAIQNDRWAQLRAAGKAAPWSKRRENMPDSAPGAQA